MSAVMLDALEPNHARATLTAAGLPHDFNAIIGRRLAYRRGDGSTGEGLVTGIRIGHLFVALHVEVPSCTFSDDSDGTLTYDANAWACAWSGWFFNEEEAERLDSVSLL